MLLKVIVVGIIGVFVLKQGQLFAQAAENYHDKVFEWTIDNDICETTEVFTEYEEKWDDTSCYLYNVTSNGCLSFFHVVGSNGGGMNDCTDYNYWNGNNSCYPGEAVFLRNWVYENGYKYAAVWFDPGNGYHNYIKVLWSPDSI